MILDNSVSVQPELKKKKVDLLQPHFHGSGEPLLAHIRAKEIPALSSLHIMPSTLSRAFPPPSLAGVPFEYILDQLHNLAPLYWGKPDTSDCTLVIPVPHPRLRSTSSHPVTFPSRPSHDPSGLGRRATEPSTLALLPRITLKLHSDYLSAHSSFLRSLFSGASQFDLINTSPAPNTPLRTSSGRFIIPFDRLPRLLNSSSEHPVLFLPVPDPSSIDLVFHWMYFGDLRYIQSALEDGIIQWEGIARNVEYLGLTNGIKVFLGNWYALWLHPDRQECNDSSSQSDSDSDLDSMSDSDERGSQRGCSSDETLVSDGNEYSDHSSKPDIDVEEPLKEPTRGRDRASRGLSWTLQYAEKFPDSSMTPATVRRAESPIPPQAVVR